MAEFNPFEDALDAHLTAITQCDLPGPMATISDDANVMMILPNKRAQWFVMMVARLAREG